MALHISRRLTTKDGEIPDFIGTYDTPRQTAVERENKKKKSPDVSTNWIRASPVCNTNFLRPEC